MWFGALLAFPKYNNLSEQSEDENFSIFIIGHDIWVTFDGKVFFFHALLQRGHKLQCFHGNRMADCKFKEPRVYPANLQINVWKIRNIYWLSSSQATFFKLGNLVNTSIQFTNCVKFSFWKSYSPSDCHITASECHQRPWSDPFEMQELNSCLVRFTLVQTRVFCIFYHWHFWRDILWLTAS